MKKNNKKGFTLAELLVVVAIIAVLVAIAIPVFGSALEKSRDAVSVANIRSAYAEAQIAYLTGTDDGNATVTETDGVITSIDVKDVAIKSQKADEWNGLGDDLPFDVEDGGEAGTFVVTFTYDDGAISEVTYA